MLRSFFCKRKRWGVSPAFTAGCPHTAKYPPHPPHPPTFFHQTLVNWAFRAVGGCPLRLMGIRHIRQLFHKLLSLFGEVIIIGTVVWQAISRFTNRNTSYENLSPNRFIECRTTVLMIITGVIPFHSVSRTTFSAPRTYKDNLVYFCRLFFSLNYSLSQSSSYCIYFRTIFPIDK